MTYQYWANKLEESAKKSTVQKSIEKQTDNFWVIHLFYLSDNRMNSAYLTELGEGLGNIHQAVRFSTIDAAKAYVSAINDSNIIQIGYQELNEFSPLLGSFSSALVLQREVVSIVSYYDTTPQDGLDIVSFLKTVLNDTDYKEVIDKVFDKPLKPIEIPSIYSIPNEVQAKYQEQGYRLVKKSDGMT